MTRQPVTARTAVLVGAWPGRTGAWRSLTLTRRVSLALFGALAVFILLTFRQHGLSNDEEVQHVYGRLLLQFYASGLADHAAFAYKNLYLYGGLFDMIAAGIEKMAPSMNVWEMRHLLSAFWGLAGMAGAWRLARHLAGEKAGIVAVILLALTGAWSGGMFTHTKDVPFAACMIWALYYTTRVLEQLPSPSPGLAARLGIAIGCAFGLRVGAVFAVGYLGIAMLAASWWVGGSDWRARGSFLARSVTALLPAGGIAFVLMALFWPWSVMAPDHLFKAATAFSHFSFPMKTILAGQLMDIGDVPGTYLPAYLLVRLPELLLAGVAVAILFALPALWRQAVPAAGGTAAEALAARRRALRVLPLALGAFLPIVFAWITAPSLYNGIRHFLFVVPPLAVLAALGLRMLWHRVLYFGLKGAAGMMATTLLAAGAHCITLAQLHPYEYLYYNRLFAGGFVKAANQWEMDYWSSSLDEAARQLTAHVRDEMARSGRPVHPYQVAVCAELIQGEAYLDPSLFQVTRDWRRADFFLSTTHLGCNTALRGSVIGVVSRMGVTLAVVRDRRELLSWQREPKGSGVRAERVLQPAPKSMSGPTSKSMTKPGPVPGAQSRSPAGR